MLKHLSKSCVCYTSDPDYLFPTLVSAIGAKRHSGPDVDVLLFSFHAEDAAAHAFGTACRIEGIRYISVPAVAIENAPVMLARLFLTRFVPPEYEHLLYIDGDTQVLGPLEPLLAADVEPGKFLASNDPMAFVLSETGREGRLVAQHFAAMGIPAEGAYPYFNTGVLRINRLGWEEIGLQAWKLFQKLGTPSRYPDQDVLNLVGNASRVPMSLAWNFPIFMRNARVEATIHPRIYHFMSSPKPWQGTFPPWSGREHAPYGEVLRRHPDLARFGHRMSMRNRMRYHLQQRYKLAVESCTWGLSGRRSRILTYERELADRLDRAISGRVLAGAPCATEGAS